MNDWYIKLEVYVEEKWKAPTYSDDQQMSWKKTEDFQSTSTYNVLIVGVIVKSGSDPLNLLSDRSLYSNMEIYHQTLLYPDINKSKFWKKQQLKVHEHLGKLRNELGNIGTYTNCNLLFIVRFGRGPENMFLERSLH